MTRAALHCERRLDGIAAQRILVTAVHSPNRQPPPILPRG